MAMQRLTCGLAVVVLATSLQVAGGGQSVGTRAEGSDRHAYFDALAARSDVLVTYSLRDPRQLRPRSEGGYAQSSKRALGVSFAPAQDSYPRKQDAAKITIPPTTNSLPNQVRLPFDHGTRGFLITWDAWWGEEFAVARTGIDSYKAFQLESGGRIWTEIRARFGRAKSFPDAVALADIRPYGAAARKGSRLGKVRYGTGSLGGLREHFAIAPSQWTRYWVLIVPREDGWWALSFWMADERRDATLLYDGEAIRPKGPGWDRFWLEFNTSTKGVARDRGELVAYVRNVVVLKAPGDVRSLLQRPKS